MKIGLYTDVGTSFLCIRSLQQIFTTKFQLEYLKASDLANSKIIESCDVFIMPGGRDRPYCERLNGEPNKIIRRFVEEGGVYLGICAGAYYACARILWDQGTPDQIDAKRELELFRGCAIGPAFGNGTFGYENFEGAKTVKIIDSSKREYKIYYHGGCYFTEPERNTKVIARYSELKGAPIAALEQPIEKGKVLLLGVHPEIGSESIESGMNQSLKQNLVDAESDRIKFSTIIWDLLRTS